ncbi:MAG: alpha/beta fold hydrolase [Sphingomonas bacterium]
MATFILIHGAWHGGWCWERLAPLLTAAGYTVLAPDLPGMGADRTILGDDPLGEWAQFVADLASAAEGPVILVGHSRGGIVISEAAERVPDCIDRLVYLAAFLLQPGESLAEATGRHPGIGPGAAIRPGDDPLRVIVDLELASPIFYNLTSQEEARAAAARLVAEPLAALTMPLRVTAERFGRVPRVYIETLHDRAVSLDMQREMQAALPCSPVMTLESDHSPFYSAVPELAKALLRLA